MRAVILFNPASGRGRGLHTAVQLRDRLRAHGVESNLLSIGELAEPDQLRAADALFILGGDGTVHHVLPLAVSVGVPIYHVPLGTENLFAREFGISRDLDRAARAALEGLKRPIDLGWCEARPADTSNPSGARVPFALMCSIGPDARVIRRLTQSRSGPIRHHSYLGPIVRELVHFAKPPLTIEVDGRRLVDAQPGMAVIANSRQYVLRIDPAPHADVSDGLLDLAFFPAHSRLGILTWLLAARLRRHHRRPGFIHARGRHFRLSTPDPEAAFQVDGELGRLGPAASNHPRSTGLNLTIGITPGALSVLHPTGP